MIENIGDTIVWRNDIEDDLTCKESISTTFDDGPYSQWKLSKRREKN